MNVRVDLGSVVPAGQEVTLIFEYGGALESPQGGPLPNARLAAVTPQGSYLFYAARWFPFHDYAADRATYEIRLRVPKGETVACFSDTPAAIEEEVDPVTQEAYSRFTFSSLKPVLPGSLAAGKYLIRSATVGGFVIDFYAKIGNESWTDRVDSVVGSHLEFYSSQFGSYPFGRRLMVVETDEETLDTYSGPGIMFVSPRAINAGLEERLAREVAYQWWGQTVGIRSFDDTLLTQGMAEFSTLLYLAVNGTPTQYQQALVAQLEKALAFEQSSSIRNAPSQLDDQSSAFRSIIFHKGALVFNMLRQLMGSQAFDEMLRDYFTRFAGRNVTLDDFEQVASAAAGRDLRFFFGQWVDSTGVPEFRIDYRVLRTRDGFRVPGTIRQDLDTFEMPIEIYLRTETGGERLTLPMQGTSVDFDLQATSMPLEVVVDPDAKILRSSEELRQGVIVRRGIEHLRQEEYVEAEQQFQAAIKLSRANSWAWYNLGLLYMTQRNWNRALDAFDQGLNGLLRPDWIEVWSYIYRGNCWDMIGQRERAVAEYNRAITNGTDYDNSQATAQGYLAQPYGRKPAPVVPEESLERDGRQL
jgi:aminopeptidase N